MDKSNVKVIVFDAFGTLVEIQNKMRPYIYLDEQLKKSYPLYKGYRKEFSPLTKPLTLLDVVHEVSRHHILEDETSLVSKYEDILKEELTSIKAFPESIEVLKTLKRHGYKIVICSNLSVPYIEPVKQLFDGLVDQYVWSCYAGFMKPEPEIYRQVQRAFFSYFSPENFFMVGDTYEADVKAPKAFGWQAIHLNRDTSNLEDSQINTLNELIPLLTK